MQHALEITGYAVELWDAGVLHLEIAVLTAIRGAEISEGEDRFKHRFGPTFVGLPGLMGVDVQVEQTEALGPEV